MRRLMFKVREIKGYRSKKEAAGRSDVQERRGLKEFKKMIPQ